MMMKFTNFFLSLSNLLTPLPQVTTAAAAEPWGELQPRGGGALHHHLLQAPAAAHPLQDLCQGEVHSQGGARQVFFITNFIWYKLDSVARIVPKSEEKNYYVPVMGRVMKPSSFGAAPALVSGITFPDSGSRGLDFFLHFWDLPVPVHVNEMSEIAVTFNTCIYSFYLIVFFSIVSLEIFLIILILHLNY